MKKPSHRLVCCLALTSTFLMRAGNSAESPAALDQHVGGDTQDRDFDCDGRGMSDSLFHRSFQELRVVLSTSEDGQARERRVEGPCDAAVRGARAFFDRRLHGLGGNGRSCADCHMAADHFQLSPASAEARFRWLQWQRRWNGDADDPLFRPIDADDFRINGERADDFSNLRQNGLVRIVFPLPPNVRLIDPMTNAPSSEVLADVWRMVPTVNNVALTGPDGTNPWPRLPNPFGGYQLDGRVATLQEQALGALTNHAEVQHAP